MNFGLLMERVFGDTFRPTERYLAQSGRDSGNFRLARTLSVHYQAPCRVRTSFFRPGGASRQQGRRKTFSSPGTLWLPVCQRVSRLPRISEPASRTKPPHPQSVRDSGSFRLALLNGTFVRPDESLHWPQRCRKARAPRCAG